MYSTVYGGGRTETEAMPLHDAAQAQGRAVVEILYGDKLEALRASLEALKALNRQSAESIAAEQAAEATASNWKEV